MLAGPPKAMNRASGVAAATETPVRVTAYVVPACISRRRRFSVELKPEARLLATLLNTIHRPSGLIIGEYELLLPGPVPAVLMLTNTVIAARRSRRKTSRLPLESPATRLSALLVKAT